MNPYDPSSDATRPGVHVEALARAGIVLRQTYALLAVTFGFYALVTFVVWQFAMPLAVHLMPKNGIQSLLFLGAFFLISYMIERNRRNAIGMTLLFVLVGYLALISAPALAMISSTKGPQLIINAALMTTGVFVAMTIVAFKAGFRASALQSFLMVGFVVVLIGIVTSLFTDLGVYSIALSGIIIIFFSVLIIYQTKLIIEGNEDSPVSAVLSLFLSAYNIFWSILSILGRE